MPLSRWFCGIATALFLAGFQPAASVAFDKKPGGKNQEKRDNERVREAQDDLKSARERLKDAEREAAAAAKQAAAAETKEKAALRAVEATRDKVEGRLGEKIGLGRALSDWKEAQKAFDEKKLPLLTELKKKPEYLAATKAAAEAMEQLRQLKGDTSLPETERKAKVSELNRLSLTPGKLEAAAVDADPALVKLRDEVDRCQEKVAALRERLKSSVDQDSEMKAAMAAVTEAKSDSRKADEAAAKERRSLAQARSKLNDAEAKLQKAQLQDRKNDGKKGKG